MPGSFALEDNYYTSHITLEDALSHRSGLPRHDLAYGWDDADVIDVILTLKDLPLTAEPRTKWQYCNIMYATVGQWLAMRGGLSFGDVIWKLIWEPLGMISTTASLKEAKASMDHLGRPRLSRGYFWNKDHYLPESYPNIKADAGAGATISSVNDYVLWIQTLLNAGSNDSSPISDSIYRDITGARMIMNDIPGAAGQILPPLYALGWFTTMIGSHTLVTHSGSVTGFGTNVYLLPDEGFGLVIMGNTMVSSNQAGALIFLAILKKLGKVSSGHDAAHLNSLHESVISHQQGYQQEFRKVKGEHSTDSKLPLPGYLKEYIGLYRHPAYGVFNVSVVEEESSYQGRFAAGLQGAIPSTSAGVKLNVRPSTRSWPYEITLKHESNTLFAAELFVSIPYPLRQISALTNLRSGFMVKAMSEMNVLWEARQMMTGPNAVKRFSSSLCMKAELCSNETSMVKSRHWAWSSNQRCS